MNDRRMIECSTLGGDRKMIPLEKLAFRPAAYAVVIHQDKILLMKTKSTGKYWFPGGGVNLGETLEVALKREVTEEAGIDVKIDKFLTVNEVFFYYAPLDEAYQNYSFFYLCSPISTKLLSDDLVDQTDESEKPRWVELRSLKPVDLQVGAQEILAEYL